MSSNYGNPTIVGEFSLSVPDTVQRTDAWSPDAQKGFYAEWFAAQFHGFANSTLESEDSIRGL